MANKGKEKEQKKVEGEEEEDFHHLVGTNVNLDYRPHADGPLPRSLAECFYSLLCQLASEHYSFTSTAASLCMDFVDESVRNQFLHQLATVLHRTKSGVALDKLKYHASSEVHDGQHDSPVSASNRRTHVWTCAVACHESKKHQDSRSVAEESSEEVFYHGIDEGKNRDRVLLLYANRMDDSNTGYCADMTRVPAMDKALLITELCKYCDEMNVRFDTFVFDEFVAGRSFFRQCASACAEAVQQFGEEETFNRDAYVALDRIEGRQKTATVLPPVTMATCDRLATICKHTDISTEMSPMRQLRTYLRLLNERMVTLSCDQRLILYLTVENRSNIFISGPAGAGKTWLERLIMREFQLRVVEYATTGSTGRASVQAGGTTINRWAGVQLAKDGYEAAKRAMYSRGGTDPMRNPCLANILYTEVLFLDEVSMINTPLFDILDRLFREVRGRHDQLFGGMQIVFVGDFFQLPPIYDKNKSKPKYRYCFEMPQWQQGIKWQFELSKVFRQRNHKFVELLNNMRKGQLTNEQVMFMHSRRLDVLPKEVQESDAFKNATRIYPDNKRVNGINKRKLDALDSEARTFYWAVEFTKKRAISVQRQGQIMQDFRRDLPVATEQVLKVGCRVLCVTNYCPDAGIINGSSGTVVAFVKHDGQPPIMPADAREKLWPSVLFDGHETPFTVKEYRWYRKPERSTKKNNPGMQDPDQGGDDPFNKDWDAYAAQIPLRLGWSCTIHKCVAGDTLIPTVHYGLCRIEEIARKFDVERGSEQNIPKTDYFLVNSEKRSKEIDQVFRGYNEPCLRITTERGYAITVSKRHPLRTVLSPIEFKWKLAPQLKIGMPLLLRAGTKSGYRKQFDRAIFEQKQQGVENTTLDIQSSLIQDFFADCDMCTIEEFGIHFIFYSQRRAQDAHIVMLNMGVISSLKTLEESKKWRISIGDVFNVRRLMKIIGDECPEKQKIVADVLEKLQDTREALDVKSAFPNIESYVEKFSQVMPIDFDISQFQQFANGDVKDIKNPLSIPLDMTVTADRIQYVKNLSDWTFNHWFVDRIVSIDECQAEVYDLHVPEGHSYIGNGFVNHNSQGMTIENLVLGTDRVFERASIYVGSSRACDPDTFFIEGKFDPRTVRADPRVVKYYESLEADKSYLFRSFKKRKTSADDELSDAKRHRRGDNFVGTFDFANQKHVRSPQDVHTVRKQHPGKQVEADSSQAFMQQAAEESQRSGASAGTLTQRENANLLRQDTEFSVLFADLFRHYRRLKRSARK